MSLKLFQKKVKLFFANNWITIILFVASIIIAILIPCINEDYLKLPLINTIVNLCYSIAAACVFYWICDRIPSLRIMPIDYGRINQLYSHLSCLTSELSYLLAGVSSSQCASFEEYMAGLKANYDLGDYKFALIYQKTINANATPSYFIEKTKEIDKYVSALLIYSGYFNNSEIERLIELQQIVMQYDTFYEKGESFVKYKDICVLGGALYSNYSISLKQAEKYKI